MRKRTGRCAADLALVTEREQFWMSASPRAMTSVVVRNLDRDWAWVSVVAEPGVMFGDLHFGNAAFRRPPPRLEALLFDPIPRRQPWPFGPTYFEIFCGGSGLVREMVAARLDR